MSNIVGANIFNDELKKPYQSYIKSALKNYSKSLNDIIPSEFENLILGNVAISNEESNVFIDESEQFIIAIDGTIYNTIDLKNDLLGEGFTFQSSKQEEVVGKYLLQFGEEAIINLDGNFAIAYSDKTKTLLIRDHIGVKPLLYSIIDKTVFFASDLKAFKNVSNEWKVDKNAMNLYFRFSYIPAPFTILESIKKLLPGHFIKIEKDNVEVIQYYSLRDAKTKNWNYEDAQKEVRRILEDAVLARLNSDKTRGAFLSGGIDSSIVSKLTNDNLDGLYTFSIGFKENEFFDESVYAQRVAEHINSNHQTIQLGREDVISSLKDILEVFDEPFADSSAVAMYFLTKESREKVQICLSGDGADEIFAGYNKHKAYMKSKNPGVVIKLATLASRFFKGGNRRSKIFNKVRQLKKFDDLLQKQWPESYWFLAEFTSKNRRQELLKDFAKAQPKTNSEEDNLQNFLWLDQEFVLPNDMLKKVDLTGRFNGLEITSPFLCRELVDFANSLPDEYRNLNGLGKRILRDAFKNDLPDEVFSRSKRGFEIPLRDWIITSFDGITEKEWFSNDYITNQGFFNFAGIQKLERDFNEGKDEESTIAMWMYIVFQNWYKQWERG